MFSVMAISTRYTHSGFKLSQKTMKPFCGQQLEVIVLIFGFCSDSIREKFSSDRTSYFGPVMPKAFRVGME